MWMRLSCAGPWNPGPIKHRSQLHDPAAGQEGDAPITDARSLERTALVVPAGSALVSNAYGGGRTSRAAATTTQWCSSGPVNT